MPKYRKKPVVVDAEQFSGDTKQRGVKLDFLEHPYVTTIHGGRVYIEEGDWIIQEPDGEHYYPCRPDVFENTYEFVE